MVCKCHGTVLDTEAGISDYDSPAYEGSSYLEKLGRHENGRVTRQQANFTRAIGPTCALVISPSIALPQLDSERVPCKCRLLVECITARTLYEPCKVPQSAITGHTNGPYIAISCRHRAIDTHTQTPESCM
ncbi:hypothetical protein J6590_039307 [Homalodisca vitripennis]|nr:hypothetical protein J6590_039307 [Homalodisca vitripennis]